ncbi:MAG: hypothetical protein ACJ8FS_09045 [Sphingomicrobium sp.]
MRDDVLSSLDGAIQLLRDNVERQHELFGSPELPKREAEDPFRGRSPNDLSSAEVNEIVNSPSVSRKTLERIATERFSVPKGSMRSFPSIPLLKEKILTSLKNDAAHRAITDVSQGSPGK